MRLVGDRNEVLFELVGTHMWAAVRELYREVRDAKLGLLLTESRNEFDFIKRETVAAEIRALDTFIAAVEETAEATARRGA